MRSGPQSAALEQLKLESPDGIDVYFDNVGSETPEAALAALRVQVQIIAPANQLHPWLKTTSPRPAHVLVLIYSASGRD